MSAPLRLRLARVLLAAAALAAALAGWAWLTGGFRVRLLGVPLSVRGEHRAAFVALLLAAIGFFFHAPLRARAAAIRARFAIPPLPRILAGTVVLASIAMVGIGVAYGSRAAGGADPYGYVSQADLWRAGDLRIRQPFAATVPWPDGEWTFSPLGYKPSDSGDQTIVPTYAPGYPLLMALFAAIFGHGAMFLVGPLCGAALAALTYGLGVRLSGPIVGAIAALAVACSPTVVFMMLSVMSDVPAAAFWAAAVLLATWRTVPAAVASAIAAGVAIAIRPNLVVAAAVPALMVAWPLPDRRIGAALARASAFAAACAPFALFVGWLFNDLYGSPLRSGYGDNSGLFSLEHAGQNLDTYPAWLMETQGPLVFLCLIGPFVALGRFASDQGGPPSRRWFYAAFMAAIVGSYFVYMPFDAWWYLRFLLPAFPFIFVLAADAVWTATGRLATDARHLAMALLAIGVIGFGGANAARRDVLAVGHGENKYIEVGRYLDGALPPNAVVYSMQHCGSIRYYSGRLTLRWDYLAGDWLDRSIAHMQQAGYEPVFLLDDWEVPRVRERFASQAHAALLTIPKDQPCAYATFLYRVTPRPGEPAAERVPQAGCQ